MSNNSNWRGFSTLINIPRSRRIEQTYAFNMLNFRKAIIAAALLICIFFLLHSKTPKTPELEIPNPLSKGSVAQNDGGNTRTGHGASSTSISSLKTQDGSNGNKMQQGQQPLVDMSRAPLIDKLAYQYPYDVDTKFPSYIWQTWKYTPASGDFGDAFRPNEASWSEKHPGFIHEVITDDVAVHLMRHLYASVPEVLEAYDAMPIPVLKADFFRYLILLARGGIYTDIDTYALRSAIEWIPEKAIKHVGLVIGIEADPDREDWAKWYSRRIQFCQWTIQAKPGHPVLREIVAHITQETLKRKKEGAIISKEKTVVEFTGPAIWTDIIFRFFNEPKYHEGNKGNITWADFTGMEEPKVVGDVVVLPITSFSPGVEQMGAKDYEDPMAFVKHDFEGMSLFGETEYKIIRVRY